MRCSAKAWAAALALSLVWSGAAEAQLFRDRETGDRGVSELRNRLRNRMGGDGNPGAAADDVGQITGTERFIRGARDATDFVGTDSGDRGFVGRSSGVGESEIRSAIEGELVQEAVDPAINRMPSQPRLQTGMYAPRLRLGFSPTMPPLPTMETSVAQRLAASSAIHTTAPVEVSMTGRTATVRGKVGSEHEKRLAALMLLFEPGISKVENQLQVASPTSKSTPASPPAKH